MEFIKNAAGLTRNPLGIIALFISLIYGMSALLLGVSVSSLEKNNQTALVYFIISFPVVVLGVFGWLVSRHHNKLYGPGDYRTDESFITAGRTSAPIAVGQRLREEVGEEIKTDDLVFEDKIDIPLVINDASSPSERRAAPAEAERASSTTLSPEERVKGAIYDAGGVDDKLSRAFAAQNLALQELQAEFGLPVARSIEVADRKIADGLIVTSTGYVVAEVKYVTSLSKYYRTLEIGVNQLMGHINALKIKNSPVASAVLIVVLEEGFAEIYLDQINEITDRARSRFPDVDIKLMQFSMLAKKYGLSGI